MILTISKDYHHLTRSETLPVESRFSYTTADLAPNGISLLAVNEDGEIHLISLISKSILHRLRTNRHCDSFSLLLVLLIVLLFFPSPPPNLFNLLAGK